MEQTYPLIRGYLVRRIFQDAANLLRKKHLDSMLSLNSPS